MPVQQTNSSFAKKLGGKVSAANAEHANKPVDTGNRRLPAGIRNGVAKLSAMYTKEQTEDNSKTPKGETFFRASAIVMSPPEHNGEKVAGMVTQMVIPLCDVPAKGERKPVSFVDNWFEFQNLFKMLGIAACPETQQTDPTGQRTEAYFMAAMKLLTDPVRAKTNPVYISFSTRGWTPPATPKQPKPEEMVFETWHGLAAAPANGQHDPAAGVQDNSTAPMPAPFNEFTPPPPAAPVATAAPANDPGDVVASLVEVAMNDPEGATEEGIAAHGQLEEMAWGAGWTKEQTAGAADWAQVGDMALNLPGAAASPPIIQIPGGTAPVTVGSRWKFAKRTKEGMKLKNNKGEEFPAQEVVVATMDATSKTCTVKTTKDGKDVVDIRSKQPVQVKFEWLE